MIKTLLRLTFYSLPLIAFAANLTEPRAEVHIQPRATAVSEPVKVTIHKAGWAPAVNRPSAASRTGTAAEPLKLQGDRPSTQEVRAYVQRQAAEHGVNPQLAVWIVKHESSFNPRAKGDGEASRGLWQISKIYHPEVSDAAAYGVASSTRWSLERIREGRANEWSTYRFCRTLYNDCPIK